MTTSRASSPRKVDTIMIKIPTVCDSVVRNCRSPSQSIISILRLSPKSRLQPRPVPQPNARRRLKVCRVPPIHRIVRRPRGAARSASGRGRTDRRGPRPRRAGARSGAVPGRGPRRRVLVTCPPLQLVYPFRRAVLGHLAGLPGSTTASRRRPRRSTERVPTVNRRPGYPTHEGVLVPARSPGAPFRWATSPRPTTTGKHRRGAAERSGWCAGFS